MREGTVARHCGDYRLCLAVMACIWFACSVYRTLPLTLWPLWLVSNLGFACLLLAFANCRIPTRPAFPFVWLGKLSFSIYVTHFFVIESLVGLRSVMEKWQPVPGAAAFYCCVLLLSTLISFVTWSMLEQPGIRMGQLVTRWIKKTNQDRQPDAG